MVTPNPTEVVSFFADDLPEGGGLPPSGNYTLKGIIFKRYDYNGRANPAPYCAEMILLDDSGREFTQYYSAGDPNKIMATPDGTWLTARPNKSSTFGVFLVAASQLQGMQELLRSMDIRKLQGLYAYWDEASMKRSGMPGQEAERTQSILVPTKLHRLPGQQATAPTPPVAGMPTPPTVAPTPPGPAPAPATPTPPAPAAPPNPAPMAPAPAPAAPPVQDMAAETAVVVSRMPAAFTLQDLLTKSLEVYAGDEATRSAVSNYIFSDQGKARMTAWGYRIEGQDVTYVGTA